MTAIEVLEVDDEHTRVCGEGRSEGKSLLDAMRDVSIDGMQHLME
jgi:hypothetical protein